MYIVWRCAYVVYVHPTLARMRALCVVSLK
jgi:hypothetical protein